MLKSILLLGLGAALALAVSISAVTVPADLQLKRQSNPTLYTCRDCLLTTAATHDFSIKEARECYNSIGAGIVKESQKACKGRCFGARRPGYTLLDDFPSKRIQLGFGWQKFVDFTNLDIDIEPGTGFARKNWPCANGIRGNVTCPNCRHS